MTDFAQLLLSGTATGAIYALAALGFTLLWQASGTINFAAKSALVRQFGWYGLTAKRPSINVSTSPSSCRS